MPRAGGERDLAGALGAVGDAARNHPNALARGCAARDLGMNEDGLDDGKDGLTRCSGLRHGVACRGNGAYRYFITHIQIKAKPKL